MSPRVLRRAILVLLGVVSLLVLWRLRSPPAPSAAIGTEAPQAVAPDAERGEGVTYRHVRGDAERWSLRADREVREADGRLTVDGNVRFEIAYSARGDRDALTIGAQHAEHDPETQRASFSEDVEVLTGSGLALETSSLAYDMASGIAETDSPVAFERKTLSGRSRGMRYEGRDERIVLPAEVHLVVREEGQEEVHISADRATLDRTTGVLLLKGNGLVRTGTGRIIGPRIKATLSPDTWRLSEVVVNGGADLQFTGGAAWTEQAGLQLGPGRYRVESQRLQIWLNVAGVPRRIVAGPQGAAMEWRPEDGGDQFRRLEAGGIDMDCDELGRVQKVKAHKDVHVTQRGGTGKGAVPAVGEAWAADLVAEVDPVSGDVTKASLLRNVTLKRGRETARSGWAIFEDGVMRLGQQPEIVDAERGARLTATRMVMGTGERRGEVEAVGNVRHLLEPGKQAGGDGLLGAGAVMVTSEHASFDFETGAGLYRTATVLRSGASEIQAHSVELREKDGRRVLVASDGVVSRWGDPQDPKKTTKAMADLMRYDESEGTLRYEGHVDFSQPGLSIRTPGTVVARLEKGAWRRFEAAGESVTMVMADRNASGTRIVYAPGESALELEGAPAQYQDASGQVSGRSLTVDMGDDTILIDGRQRQRTRMMIRREAQQP